jgi:hypothetical protein
LRAARIGEHVHFTGFLSQEDLLALYHSCHVFLHPSEMPGGRKSGGIPNSILEAMATGMPVLRHGMAVSQRRLKRGRCGALVEERDYAAWRRDEEDHRTPHSFAEMGVLASESICDHFEQRHHIAKLESHYREAIEIAREVEAGAARSVADGGSPVSGGTRAGKVGRLRAALRPDFTAKKTPESRLSARATCSSVCAT